MPSDAASDFMPQRRLHPISWLFGLTALLKQFIVPLAAFVFFGMQDNYAVWGLVAIVPLTIGAIWQQLIYRYDFGPRGLMVHEGLFFRNHRQIDYQRIENIDTERSVLHRLLGVAQVRVETSSGGKPEALIRVLGLDAVDEMRSRIFAQADTTLEPQSEQELVPPHTQHNTLLHLPPVELVRFGLIDNRGMLVIAGIFGVLAQTGFMNQMMDALEPFLEHLPFGDLLQLSLATQILLAVGSIIGIIIATRILSIVLALITLFDFTLLRKHNADASVDLRSSYGLFTKVAMTLRQRRIQAVHQKETLLHRWFHRVSLQVEIAGGGGGEMQQNNGNQKSRELWLAPLCRLDAVTTLIQSALPQVTDDTLRVTDWQPLAPRAGWRLFRLFMWLWLFLATLPGIYFLHWWSLLIFVAGLSIGWLYARQYVRHTGWVIKQGILLYKHGWLTRRLAIVPLNRIQSVVLQRSPFDRRYKMATVNVDTAGSASWGQRVNIAYMDEKDAAELARRLYANTEEA